MLWGLAGRGAEMSISRRGRQAIARALRLDLTHAQCRYARVLRSYVEGASRWLEVGCGRQVLPSWAMPLEEQRQMVSRASLFVGIDPCPAIREHPLLREKVIALAGALPFKEGSFDLVTANMVLEHAREPAEFLADVRRVLKPGGKFLFHTPNYFYYLTFLASLVPDGLKRRIVQILEQRREEDVWPACYRANTPGRIRELAEHCKLHVELLSVVGSAGSFGRLWALGWLECVPLKVVSVLGGGKYGSNLMVVLRR